VTWSSAFQILGGVGLFLFGIKLMSEALQYLAGDKMRQLIGSLTRTPIRGVFIGALVAMLIQSSSGTTVMTVSFVHAGLMSLKQAVGVIMGANIGTTVIAQIVAFKVKDFALPILGIGVLLVLFGRTKRQKYVGNGLVGFGLLFLGMQTMEGSMAFLRDRKDLFLAFSSSPMLGLLVGTAVTMVVQASSATIGLTMAMAAQGLLPLEAALPILLGDNIGTTITAVLASLGSNRSAKQAATAHVLFNVIGASIFLACLPFYKGVVASTSADIGRQIANAHTIFNVTNTLLFLPFVPVLVWVIRRIVPDKGGAVVAGPMYLDMKLVSASPAAAVDAVKKELLHMGDLTRTMLTDVRRAFTENNPKMIGEVTQTEKAVNEINRAISSYASEIWQSGLSSELSTVLGSYVNGVGDIERIGDHATNLIELYEYKLDHGFEFSTLARGEFDDMFDLVERAVRLSFESLNEEDVLKAKEVDALEDEVDRKEKILRKNHILRLNKGECTPAGGVIFIDILSNLERVCDHAHNISLIAFDISKLHK
jgi:phosphate:Na+ symporter